MVSAWKKWMNMLGDAIVKNVAQAQSDAVLVASCGAVGKRSIVVNVSVCYRTAVVDTHTHTHTHTHTSV